MDTNQYPDNEINQETTNLNEEGESAENPTDAAVTLPKKPSVLSSIYDFVEIFAVAIIAVLLLFTFGLRLCRVDGGSMNNTLKNGERIISTNTFYTPKQGDIIVFHLSNEYYEEPLVKRVIATEGQTVYINFTTGVIKVDGVVYDDPHAFVSGGKYEIKAEFDQRHIYSKDGERYYCAAVPEGCVFVLGDNRNNSADSRSAKIGFVDTDTILGKAIIRLSPFTVID